MGISKKISSSTACDTTGDAVVISKIRLDAKEGVLWLRHRLLSGIVIFKVATDGL
ncbi:MAG: hypothetical protein OEZ15_01370 [Gammaproteobacteria bacterium]|nr:hypothetical protein [Gammaproteobacteria bacterium]